MAVLRLQIHFTTSFPGIPKKSTPATETTIQVMSLWNEITWKWLSGGWPRARDYRKTRSFRWLDLKVSCTHGDQTQHPGGRWSCFYQVLHAVTGMIYRILEYFSLKLQLDSLGWFDLIIFFLPAHAHCTVWNTKKSRQYSYEVLYTKLFCLNKVFNIKIIIKFAYQNVFIRVKKSFLKTKTSTC